ncbi:MAG: Asp-tRNA(Asn)/Glu-tRNA(Gln) amidotransferase GatCAB subunit B, partial [Verrucomicrobiota bacterium]
LQARISDSGIAVEDVRIQPEQVRELVGLVEGGVISSKIAQDVFAEMFTTGDAPKAIVERNGWSQVSDVGALEALCDQAIAANPGPVADFRAGKAAALNALKGQVMKLSKGKANPALAGEILERKLKA